jgi:hypothetical protein
MKVVYRPAGNDRMVFEVEAETMQDLWERFAEIDELFTGSALTCKKGSEETTNVKHVVRTDDDDNKYYELQSDEAFGHPLHRARKAYGCNKKGGGLFPKRKDKEGNYLPDGGWTIYNSKTGKEE